MSRITLGATFLGEHSRLICLCDGTDVPSGIGSLTTAYCLQQFMKDEIEAERTKLEAASTPKA